MINDDDDDGHLSNDSKKTWVQETEEILLSKTFLKRRKISWNNKSPHGKEKKLPQFTKSKFIQKSARDNSKWCANSVFFYVSIAAATTTFLGETRKKSTLRKMIMFTKMLKKILLLLPLILIEVNLLEQKSTYIPTIILLSLVAQD